jgi:acyl-coenzyme A thioesterase PaaI-like protein
MTEVKDSKTIAASRVRLIQMMGPEHANAHGNVHGGNIMKIVDVAGALVCMRHAQAWAQRQWKFVPKLRRKIRSQVTQPARIRPTWCTWRSMKTADPSLYPI